MKTEVSCPSLNNCKICWKHFAFSAGAALSPHYSSYPLTVDLSRSDHDVLSTSDYDPDSSNDNPVHEGGSSIRDPVSSRKEKDGQSVNMPESRYYSPDGSSEDLTPHFSTTGSSAISGSAVAAGTSGYTTLRGSSVTPSGYFSSRRGVYYSPNPISLPGPVFPFPMGFGLPLTLPGLSVMPTGSGGALKLPCCIHCSLTDMLCMFNCQMCV